MVELFLDQELGEQEEWARGVDTEDDWHGARTDRTNCKQMNVVNY
jgi:hypothetical protein